MAEDWSAEAAANPHPSFSLFSTLPDSYVRLHPMIKERRYVKAVYGRTAAAQQKWRASGVTQANYHLYEKEQMDKYMAEVEARFAGVSLGTRSTLFKPVTMPQQTTTTPPADRQ
jgi:hypothetical protein